MTDQIDSNRAESREKSLSRMASCFVLHSLNTSENCCQGIRCIKRAQEVINTAGNRESDGLKIYGTL